VGVEESLGALKKIFASLGKQLLDSFIIGAVAGLSSLGANVGSEDFPSFRYLWTALIAFGLAFFTKLAALRGH
jgi:hypothetical protein